MASGPGPTARVRPIDTKRRLVWMASSDERTAHLFPARSGTALCGVEVLWRTKPLTVEHRCEGCIEARRAQGG